MPAHCIDAQNGRKMLSDRFPLPSNDISANRFVDKGAKTGASKQTLPESELKRIVDQGELLRGIAAWIGVGIAAANHCPCGYDSHGKTFYFRDVGTIPIASRGVTKCKRSLVTTCTRRSFEVPTLASDSRKDQEQSKHIKRLLYTFVFFLKLILVSGSCLATKCCSAAPCLSQLFVWSQLRHSLVCLKALDEEFMIFQIHV